MTMTMRGHSFRVLDVHSAPVPGVLAVLVPSVTERRRLQRLWLRYIPSIYHLLSFASLFAEIIELPYIPSTYHLLSCAS